MGWWRAYQWLLQDGLRLFGLPEAPVIFFMDQQIFSRRAEQERQQLS